MRRYLLPAAILSVFATGTAFAQTDVCQRPLSINIPDGASATLDAMLDAQSGVRDFIAAMEGLLDCLDTLINGADEETPPDTLNAWIEEYNAAVGEMEATATRFNEERVAYQQANPSE